MFVINSRLVGVDFSYVADQSARSDPPLLKKTQPSLNYNIDLKYVAPQTNTNLQTYSDA